MPGTRDTNRQDSVQHPSTELDMEMMRRITARDPAAFNQLYDRLAKPLFSVAIRMLRQPEDAEEVVQEVLLKIWTQAESYDSARGTPFGWAMTMTRSKAIDRLRALGRRERLQREIDAEPDRAHGQEAAGGDAAETERVRTLRNVVAKLSPEQREAIDLAFFSGFTQTEIAEKLSEPLGTVKARIRRGLSKLRDLLAGKV